MQWVCFRPQTHQSILYAYFRLFFKFYFKRKKVALFWRWRCFVSFASKRIVSRSLPCSTHLICHIWSRSITSICRSRIRVASTVRLVWPQRKHQHATICMMIQKPIAKTNIKQWHFGNSVSHRDDQSDTKCDRLSTNYARTNARETVM